MDSHTLWIKLFGCPVGAQHHLRALYWDRSILLSLGHNHGGDGPETADGLSKIGDVELRISCSVTILNENASNGETLRPLELELDDHQQTRGE